jgi:hypothetical protein
MEIPQPEIIVQFIAGWFPFFQFPAASVDFKINKIRYEEVDRLASEGKISEALSALNPETLDPNEKDNLIRAMAEKKISGAVAWLEVHEGKISAGDSIALITDGRTGWMISQEELPNPEGTILTVGRTGADFLMKIREIVEKLTGIPFPRQEVDPAGTTMRFALSLDELSVALASINCTNLSIKMYAGLSGDHTGKYYGERMMKAQQSLIDNGLCSLSERGLPILKKDLAQAAFPIANSDFMLRISGSDGGPTTDTGVYVVRGRFFTSYRNFGKQFQVLEYGKYEGLAIYLESVFPDFGSEQDVKKEAFGLSFDSLQKAFEKIGSKSEIVKILTSNNVPGPDADYLAEDFSSTSFRAMITRRNAPERKKKKDQNPDIKEEENHLQSIFLLKSPQRSWMFQFYAKGEKGTAALTDREGFRKALAELIG